MKFNETGAFILSETKQGERIVSCGGRISTRPGTAVELYKKATDKDKNLNLVSKVVASGHKTILEHHYFNIAFNNVSIFIEQYLIEFRLASFTIKSGRYVNFSGAGFNLPNAFTPEQQKLLKSHYKKMFKVYDKFVAAGVPVEDARFILPYGLKTNIYMSMNARELIHVVCSMIYGRGKYYEEIIELGLQLKAQFDERYPGLIEANAKYYTDNLAGSLVINQEPCKKPEYVSHSAELIAGSTGSANAIQELAKASGYDNFDFNTALKALKSMNGIGDKVANCVILFGLCIPDAFPVDVWMKKALTAHYPKDFDPKVFGENAGLAQQYIFYYARSGNV